jgi:hypothetical protein
MVLAESATIDGVEVLSAYVERDKRLLQIVRDRLSRGSQGLLARKVSKKDLMSSVIVSMWWDFGCEVTGIFYDQWGGLSVQHHSDESFRVWVEWAHLEEGLAAAWQILADRFPEKLMLPPE